MDDTMPDPPATARPPARALDWRPAGIVPTGTARAPRQWHRGMTLLAVVSLFIGTRSAWTIAIATMPAVGGIISVGYAGILVCGVLALVVRSRRALTRVDLGVLVLAVVLVACRYALHHDGNDEGVLTAQAASQIVHGRPVYGQPWPWLFGTPRVGLTKTMSGGGDYTYVYPPLTALLTAPVYALLPSSMAATLVVTIALVAGTVALWFQLPAPWRPAATAVCLGFGLVPAAAANGYPAVVAVALLVPVVVRWPATGAGGRLGRSGVLRAVCLGAACASQQLAWFLLFFLLAGLYAVRRGELGARGARRVLARYVGTAALTWTALNAYFAAQGFGDWLSGLLLPFTQKAILHGQGLMGISYYFTDGSRRLDFYSYSTLLLLLGLLATALLYMRRLGPALTVLPWLPLYFATRSQDGYYLLMTPLWLAAAATVPAAALATAWQPRLPRLRQRRLPALPAVAALTAPALLCAGVAAASSPPMRLSLTPHYAQRAHLGVTGITVHAVNVGGTTLTPHWASRTGQGASSWWHVRSGPAKLAPGESATYVLVPPSGFRVLPGRTHPRMRLIAVTGTPMTITSASVELPEKPTPAET